MTLLSRPMIALLPVALTLAACGANCPPPAVEIKTVEVIKEVMRPCPVTIPQKPGALARPLPTDTAALAALLGAKLAEWAGPGGYGERAEAALKTCTAPTPPSN